MALRERSPSRSVRASVEIRPQLPEQGTHGPHISGDKPRLSVLKNDEQEPLSRALSLAQRGQFAEAWEIAERHLAYVNPNSCSALTVGVDIWRRQNKPAVAYQFAKRVTEIDPSKSIGWSNLAMLADNLYRFDEAETCFNRAINLARTHEEKANTWTNWACMLINKGDWQAAEVMARKALQHSPDSNKCRMNLGLACLALGKWREGWPLYDAIIGLDQSRRKVQYKDEPEWDGKPCKTLVVYGEQGIGDEISFVSMVPDAAKVAESVILDCTDRLAGLFRRSFPQCQVYGTRWDKGLGWDRSHTKIDASVSVGALGKRFRNETANFPGTPYLIPDPDRVAMWQGLFAKQGKPVIGIAWSGGVAWTGDRFRKITLEQLLPLFKSVDAVWVSLQYTDASKEIAAFKAKHDVDIRQYAYGTLTNDYDDTAALVAALDLTIAPPTSVVHLAGAMGAPCIAMQASVPCWKFYGGLQFHRTNMMLVPHRENWDNTIADTAAIVAAYPFKARTFGGW